MVESPNLHHLAGVLSGSGWIWDSIVTTSMNLKQYIINLFLNLGQTITETCKQFVNYYF